MEVSDAFGTIAEITIAIAGFMGVIAVFNKASLETNEQFLRVTQSFLQCGAMIIGILLPYVMIEFHFDSEIVWRVPKLFLGLAYPMILSFGLFLSFTGKMKVSYAKLSYSMATITFAVSIFLLLSGAGFLLPESAGVLLAGLVWYLVLALYSFLAALRWALE